MAKKPSKPKPKKETIKPPTAKELADAARLLRQGHPDGARVLADESVAVRQKAAKKRRKP